MRPTPRETLAAYFSRQHPDTVVSAYLFGSHARGQPHRESDVDVAVLLDHARLPGRTDRGTAATLLATDLIAATHCNEVDVVVLNDAPPELAVAVLDSGLCLYRSDRAADHAFARTARSRYADLRPFLERTRRLKLAALAR